MATALAGERRIGLGCMALTGLYGAVSIRQAQATIFEAIDQGITLFDTAPLYGDGANEKLIGDTIGTSQNATIITKFGLHADRSGKLHRDSSPNTIRQSVEKSLRRLRRDRIDLLLQHRQDEEVPLADIAGCIERLVAEGKVKAFGLSNVGSGRLVAWLEHRPVTAVQNELSLMTGGKAEELTSVCEAGAAYIAYSPLGKGLLCGSPGNGQSDYRARLPNFKNPDPNLTRIRNRLATQAARTGTTTIRAAIDWVRSQSDNIVAIPGCRSPEQVCEILSAPVPTLGT